MRKLVLWLMLFALVLCPYAALAETTEPFTDFELKAGTYKSDGQVIIKEDSRPYYGNVRGYVSYANETYFAGTLTENYSGDIPYGTLTVTDASSDFSGQSIALSPENDTASQGTESVKYDFERYFYDSMLSGKKVLVNLPTSPDVFVKSFVLPSQDLKVSFDTDEIIPYLTFKYSFDEEGQYYPAVDFSLSFRKADAMGTALESPGVENVKIYINPHINDEHDTVSYADEIASFDVFTGTQTYQYLNDSSHGQPYFTRAAVTYELDGELYTWYFYRDEYFVVSDSIEWGEIEEPIELSEGEEKTFTIKIPASYTLSSDNGSGEINEVFVNYGNGDVVQVVANETKLTQGEGGEWDGLTYNENKSELSFTLAAGSAGTTTLIIHLPGIDRDYLREVNVTGSTTPADGANSNSVKLSVSRHVSRVRTAGGKPYYPSAKFREMEFALSSDVNLPEEVGGGYFGLKSGSISEIFQIYRPDAGSNLLRVASGGGVIYDSSDSSNNKEYADMLITEDLSACTAWWEIPGVEGNSYNVVSRAMNTLEFRTTETQLADFVPYVEYDSANSVVNWKFVKVSGNTTTDVNNPEISNLSIVAHSSYSSEPIYPEGTSGTIENIYTRDFAITFMYDYDGVTYEWRFEPANGPHYSYYVPLVIGESRNMIIYPEEYSNNYGVDLAAAKSANVFVVRDDLISVTPETFTPSDNMSITITGKARGFAYVDVLFELADESGFFKIPYDVRVTSEDSGSTEITTELASSDVEAKLDIYSTVTLIEGRPYYETAEDNEFLIELKRVDAVSYDKYHDDALYGTCKAFIGDEEVYSYSLYPEAYEYDDELTYAKIRYVAYIYGDNLENITHISWEFPCDVNAKGSFDLTSSNIRKTKAQVETFKPYAQLNRNGINVNSIEWNFVDADGNEITASSDISSFDIEVYIDSKEYSSDQTAGIFENVNEPEVSLGKLFSEFEYEGVGYRWYFYDTMGVSSSSSSHQGYSRVLSWDVDVSATPFVIYVGDKKTVTVTAASTDEIIPFIGDSSIVEIGSAVSVADVASKTFTLTAKKAGMTSLTLYYKGVGITTYPREIWVAEKNSSTGKYEVPGLTTDLETLMSELTDGEFVYNGKDSREPQKPQEPENPGGSGGSGESETPSETQPAYDTVSESIDKPAEAMNPANAAVKTKVRNSFSNSNNAFLKNIIANSPDIEIVDITSDDSVKIMEKTTSADIPDNILETISNDSQQVAVTFNKVKIDVAKIFVFKGKSALPAGSKLYWRLVKTQSASGASLSAVKVSAELDENSGAVFYDENGTEITETSSANQAFHVAAYIEPGEYIPAVTSDAPGTQKGSGQVGSSGGGCNSGYGFISVALLGLALMFKKD